MLYGLLKGAMHPGATFIMLEQKLVTDMSCPVVRTKDGHQLAMFEP